MIVEKARESNHALSLAFIDYKKAFDSVNHHKLWNVVRHMGVGNGTMKAIWSLYVNQHAAIRVESVLNKTFQVKREGCLPSPIWFNLYSEVTRKSVDDLA